MMTVFVEPDGNAVIMDFPSPVQQLARTRQPFLRIYEAPWEGGDPAQDYAADIAASTVAGKQLYEINGIPALGVSANSPSDSEHLNAAYLRLVVNGVDIEISGGDSIQRLIAIAEGMTSNTLTPSPSTPTPSASRATRELKGPHATPR
jgi:hypothetical protein